MLANNHTTDDDVSFCISQLNWFVDGLDFTIKNLPTLINYLEEETVTLRQFNDIKKTKQAFESKIKQLNDINNQLEELILITEPYREPLKAV